MSEPLAPGPSREIVILADDLTGACDTAQPFATAAPTGVLTRGLEGLEQARGWRILSINGRTRSLDPEAARTVTRDLLLRLGDLEDGIIYKKIDSTLRGNVAAELRGVGDAFPGRPLLVAPAFPAMGRTTVAGRVLVGGVPVNETEYAADSRHPVRDASLLSLCKWEGGPEAELIGVAQVRQGAAALAAALARARGRARFLCIDAETDADLEAIAQAIEIAGPACVLAGSAGLAGALARVRCKEVAAEPLPRWPADGRRLALIGTRNPAMARQVEWVHRQGLAALVPVHPDHCRGDGRNAEVGAAQVHARAALAAGRDVAVHVAGGYVPEVSASRLLADLVDGIPRHEVRGLVLSGGGTAEAVLQRLGAWGIRLLGGAIPEGCSLGHLQGGRYEGLPAILKAGGFGGETLLGDLLTLRTHPPWRGGDG